MKGALTGRTALVSGASRGIGLAIAKALAAAGARVALVARSADVLAKRVTEIGARALAITADVSDEAQINHAVAEARRAFGDAPDIVVNNAGLFVPRALESTSPQAFRDALAVNLVAPFLLIRAFLPRMCERGTGHLVTIGSAADRHAYIENAAYAAGKTGVRAMHEVLRLELRGSGVRNTLVSPGAVDTGLWDAIEPDGRGRYPARNAMLEVEDVAHAVVYAVTQPPRVNVDELRLARA
jgi:NADP-dependent 3-hydroxy acid dehydrogenase YdfG